MRLNTPIYVNNYSWGILRIYDIKLGIDGDIVLNDSVVRHRGSKIYDFLVYKKMKYGFHRIYIRSEELDIIQEDTVFLLPNQYIMIELFPADTLTVEGRSYKDAGEEELLISEKSKFDVRTVFKPYYIE